MRQGGPPWRIWAKRALLGDPQGVEGVGAGPSASVTASRMTDTDGASTLRVPHDPSDLSDKIAQAALGTPIGVLGV